MKGGRRRRRRSKGAELQRFHGSEMMKYMHLFLGYVSFDKCCGISRTKKEKREKKEERRKKKEERRKKRRKKERQKSAKAKPKKWTNFQWLGRSLSPILLNPLNVDIIRGREWKGMGGKWRSELNASVM